MGLITLFKVTDTNMGIQFVLKDYPSLDCFKRYVKRKEVKRLSIEQYFHSIKKDYKEYTKLIYGPVFGMEDPRNGFVYEHNTTGELIRIDETDIPTTNEMAKVINGDVISTMKANTSKLVKGIITDYKVMDKLHDEMSDGNMYNQLIRDDWMDGETFLMVE